MEDVNYTHETIKNMGVNFEDLWYSFDGDIILDNPEDDGGKPFSGIAYELHNNGKLAYFCFYKNGLKHGVYKSFYESGKIKCHQFMQYGFVSGKSESFFESGNIKSICNSELGIKLSYKEWDENGSLIINEELSTDSSNYKLLLSRGEEFKRFKESIKEI